MRKKLIIIFTLSLILLCGCSDKQKLSVDACLRYMEDKYGMKFAFVEPYDNFQPTASSLQIYARTDAYPSKVLVVEERVDDEFLFHDNFVAIKYEQEVQAILNGIADEVFDECRVIYDANGYDGFLPDRFGADTTLDEYITERKSNISVTILVPPEHGTYNKDSEIMAVYDKCCRSGLICAIEVYYANDRSLYETINTTPEMLLSGDWYDEDGVLVMDKDFGIQWFDWR